MTQQEPDRRDRWARAMLDSLRDEAAFGTAKDGTVVFWSASAERLFGRGGDAIVGRSITTLADDSARVDFVRDPHAVLEQAEEQGFAEDQRWWRVGPSRFWGSLTVTRTRTTDPEAPHFTVVVRDLTKHKREEDFLRHVATTDAVTGVHNRRYMDDALKREFERWRRYGVPLAVIMFDADRFKSVNDRFGHATGDAVLRGIAGACKNEVRELDIVARWGGEEFIVLMPSVERAGAVAAAERIRARVAAWSPKHVNVTVTLSAGVAEATADVTAPEELVRRADEALYEAKQRGRNRVIVSRRGRTSGIISRDAITTEADSRRTA